MLAPASGLRTSRRRAADQRDFIDTAASRAPGVHDVAIAQPDVHQRERIRARCPLIRAYTAGWMRGRAGSGASDRGSQCARGRRPAACRCASSSSGVPMATRSSKISRLAPVVSTQTWRCVRSAATIAGRTRSMPSAMLRSRPARAHSSSYCIHSGSTWKKCTPNVESSSGRCDSSPSPSARRARPASDDRSDAAAHAALRSTCFNACCRRSLATSPVQPVW